MSKCADLQSAVDSIDINSLDNCEKAQLLVLCKLDKLISGNDKLISGIDLLCNLIASRGIDSAGGSSSGGGSSSSDLYYYKYNSVDFDLMAKGSRAGKKFYKYFMDGLAQDWGDYEVDVYGNKIGSVKIPSEARRSDDDLRRVLGL